MPDRLNLVQHLQLRCLEKNILSTNDEISHNHNLQRIEARFSLLVSLVTLPGVNEIPDTIVFRVPPKDTVSGYKENMSACIVAVCFRERDGRDELIVF